MPTKNLELFNYHDYREFLTDWFSFQKENQSFSLRDFAEKCGLSTGYLPMVLSGKRNLSLKGFEKLQPALKLNQEETQYFKALLDLSDSQETKERLRAFDEIKKLRSFQQKSKSELEVFKYLSSWLNVTIRELALRKDFKADPEWIQKRLILKVSLNDISESLRFLIDHKFLLKHSSGYKPSAKQLNCFAGVFKLSLAEFHKQMFMLAAHSIDATPRDQRNLLGHTFMISEKQIEPLRLILDDTLKRVESLSNQESESGPVYHVILSTFPITKEN
jgi:uncharacterized protein (TIGR02147 family)